MYNYHDSGCPFHKKDFDKKFDKKKKDAACHFDKVEQDNKNTQNANIVQESYQTNYFIVLCGDKGKPKIGGLSFGKDAKAPKFELDFDEEGNVIVNGKALKGKSLGEDLKMYALRERKTNNKYYGNQPEEVNESVEEYPEEVEYDEEDFDEEDYWEFDY